MALFRPGGVLAAQSTAQRTSCQSSSRDCPGHFLRRLRLPRGDYCGPAGAAPCNM